MFKINKSVIVKYFFAIFLIIVPLYSILFANAGKFINGGDTDWYFNAKLYLSRALYNWWDVSLGVQNNLHFTSLYSILQYVVSLLFPENNFFGQRVFIAFYIVILFIFSYKLVSRLIHNKKRESFFSIDSLLISLFYFYNIVFFFFMHHIQFKTLILYTFLPVISYLLMIYTENGKPLNLFFGVLATVFFLPALGHFQIFIMYYFFVLIFVFLYYRNVLLWDILIKRLVIFSVLIFGIIFAFLIPAIFNQLSAEFNDLTTDYSKDSLQNRYNDFLNCFQFVGGYGWKFYDKDFIGRQSFEYRHIYDGIGSVILFIPVILLTVCSTIKRQKSRVLQYLFLVILMLVLLSGPFYLKINDYLPQILSIIFRSFFNFYVIAPLFLLITFAILYKKNKGLQSLILIFLSVYYLSFLYIIMTGQLVNKYWYVDENLALKYMDYVTEINNDKTLFRVINEIPDNAYNQVYVRYENYFIGPDYYFTVLNNALVSNYSYPSLNQNSLDKSRSIINFKKYSDPQANIKYIIKSNSVDKNTEFYPRIFSNGAYFQKINPVKYHIFLKNIRSLQPLSFLESFHKNWKLYLKSNPTHDWCRSMASYVNPNTIECEHEQKFFEGDEMSYLYKKPIFDDTHGLVDDYANDWEINPEFIKQNYSKDYYEQNPDGSINIELVLYFAPQTNFFLSLMATGLIVVSCFIYVIYDWQKKKAQIK